MNLKLNTLAKKIGFGYAAMIIILIVAIVVTIVQVRKIDQSVDELLNVNHPSKTSGIELVNGINHSIAALRGYLLFEDEQFKKELNQCRDTEILPAYSDLILLAEGWNDQDNIKLLNQIRPLVDEMNSTQKEVVKVARSDSSKAIDLLEDRVVSLNKEVRNLMGDLISGLDGISNTRAGAIKSQIEILRVSEWGLLSTGVILAFLLTYILSKSLVKPITGAVSVAKDIAEGDLNTKVNVGGYKEVNDLGESLSGMKRALRKTHLKNEQFSWLTTGQNKLYESIRGDKTPEELAQAIIKFVTEYTKSSIGVLYVKEDNGDTLKLFGSHSYDSIDFEESVKIGKGIVGEVARTGELVYLENVEESKLRINSSLISTVPKDIAVIPFLFENEVLGVIELGKLDHFSDNEIEFIESNMETVGIAMNSCLASEKIQELLEETRIQSEELQQQQEELEQNNEELEEQTQGLKQQQEELQVANEELEEQSQLLEEKNKNLESARTDIELKAKQLEVTSKYKSEFLANMSHELRTPLNSLLILSKDLSKNAKGNLDEEQVESAEVINKSGYDLLNLINEILDLSKIEAGKMNLNIDNLTIDDVISNLNGSFKKQAEEKGIELNFNVDDTIPVSINTDQQRLEQVLKNLISNAIKFTDTGQVNVEFTKDAGDNLEISVEDTGIGIPQDKLDTVFEAFQQVDGSTSRKYGGTGLGLSISRELARILHGTIKLESEVGKGSVFTLTIPMSLKNGEKQIIDHQVSNSSKKESSIEQNKEFIDYPAIADNRNSISPDDQIVLIIEDDKEFAEILANQAKKKGFKYLAASTGEDGLILAQKYVPNAIILDIGLPGMDGNAVIADLKSNPKLRHIPVHVISGEEKNINPLKFGALEFLEKPVTGEELNNAFTYIESFTERKMKNLLIIEDNDDLRSSIIKLIGNGDVECYEASTGKEAIEVMKNKIIDCIVLDLGLPDMEGKELIKAINESGSDDKKVPPIIIYTGKELSREENNELQEFAETIIVKGVKSEERLLDETALFLHRAVENLPSHKQKIISGLHDVDKAFKDKKVLLVDDDMRNIFALSKVLIEKGIEVFKADNGKTALKTLEKNPTIELVLMDIMMPEMDGYECTKRIRQNIQFSDLPIIALTAKAMKEDRKKCIDAGANDYITKPVDTERLFSMMRIWLQK